MIHKNWTFDKTVTKEDYEGYLSLPDDDKKLYEELTTKEGQRAAYYQMHPEESLRELRHELGYDDAERHLMGAVKATRIVATMQMDAYLQMGAMFAGGAGVGALAQKMPFVAKSMGPIGKALTGTSGYITGKYIEAGWYSAQAGDTLGVQENSLKAVGWGTATGLGLYSYCDAGRAPSRLYVHLTEADYQEVVATGTLGRGYQGAGRVLGKPFDEGRIWATPYTLEELQGLRGLLSGIDPGKLAQMTRTIEISGEAAEGFSLAIGPSYSLNGFGWLKSFGGQYQFRGMLPFQEGEVITTLSGAEYFTAWQQAVLRAGELERLGLYTGAIVTPLGIYYYSK